MSSARPTVSEDALRGVVAAATLAPSLHNSQPWRFRVDATGVDLYADRSRGVPVLDPTGRQLVLSCGAALFHARVGARSLGLTPEVTPLPDDDPDHLARIDLRPGPPPDADERALAEAMPRRHTQRQPFENRPLDPALVRSLREAVESEGAWLDVLGHREDEIATALLVDLADRVETADPAYRAEVRRWTHREPGAYDGIPATALPAGPPEGRHSDVRLRDFTVEESAPPARPKPPGTPPDERPTLAILATYGDEPADWLAAGQALAHLLLRATVDGVAASPLGQVIDLPGPREQLRQLLRLGGHPQMVLRMGYGRQAPATPRRPVEEVLDR